MTTGKESGLEGEHGKRVVVQERGRREKRRGGRHWDEREGLCERERIKSLDTVLFTGDEDESNRLLYTTIEWHPIVIAVLQLFFT
jgi:hypothetical protein